MRLLVNNRYTEDDLPQVTLENDVYLGAANRRVAFLVPNFSSLSASDQEDVKVVVQHEVAISVLKSELEALRESTEQMSEDRRGIEISERISMYESKNKLTISRVNPSSSVSGSDGGTQLITTTPTW